MPEFIGDSFLMKFVAWTLQVGIVTWLIKFGYERYQKWEAERDILREQRDDARDQVIKNNFMHVDRRFNELEKEIRYIRAKSNTIGDQVIRIANVSPDLATEEKYKKVLEDIARFQRLVTIMREVVERMNRSNKEGLEQYEKHMRRIMDIEVTLSNITATIVTLNNRIAEGKIVTKIDVPEILEKKVGSKS